MEFKPLYNSTAFYIDISNWGYLHPYKWRDPKLLITGFWDHLVPWSHDGFIIYILYVYNWFLNQFNSSGFQAESQWFTSDSFVASPWHPLNLNTTGFLFVLRRIPQGARVYISIDIDGLDPSIAPGTGTPSHGGFIYYEVKDWMAFLTNW